MNKKNLKIIFDNYIEKFDMMNNEVHREYFKWEAFDRFREEWNKSHESFALKLKRAMNNTDILIDGKVVQPATGIVRLSKISEEEANIEALFNKLVATEDKGDIAKRQKRIESFVSEANDILAKYEPKSWKYKQDFRSALFYVNLVKPMDNYAYKSTASHAFADYTAFSDDIGQGQTFSLVNYYRMCDELLKEIKKYPKLLELHYSRPYLRNASKPLESQDNLHILVFDIIYCAHAYDLFNGITLKKSSKKASEELDESMLVEEYSAKAVELNETIAVLSDEIKKYAHFSFLNKTVNHKVYKQGSVVEQNEDYIIVKFPLKQCRFQIPRAIAEGFISVSHDIDASCSEHLRLLKEIENKKSSLNRIEESLHKILGE